MLKQLTLVALITLTPFLELRASIPYGILENSMHWSLVVLTAIIINILLGAVLYLILDKIIHLFFFIKTFERFYTKTVEKTQKKIHPYVEKYGTLGLAVFIGIPFPGSGVYSGTLAAYVLGYNYKDYLLSVIFGVLIAATAVTLITLTGVEAFSWALKIV